MCAVDEGNEGLEIVVDGEALEGEVAGGLVVGVPVAGEVVGADGHAAEVEVGADAGSEEVVKDVVAVFGGEGVEGCPAKLVEAAAEALDFLGWVGEIYGEVEAVPVPRGFGKWRGLPRGGLGCGDLGGVGGLGVESAREDGSGGEHGGLLEERSAGDWVGHSFRRIVD